MKLIDKMGKDSKNLRTRTIFKWAAWATAVVVALGVIFGVGSFAFDWLNTGKNVVGPANVKEQWRFAYDLSESLNATARQVCIAERALKRAVTSEESSQRQSQLIAYEQTYARIQADYDARMKDAFRGKLVKPRDVPDEAPTLKETKAKVCDK